jgi:transposase-like protein
MREKCPKCGSNGKKHRYGKTAKGTQRFRCQDCKSVYVTEIKYDDDFKMRAMRVYFESVSGRAVGRIMGVSKGIIWYWMAQYVRKIEEKADGYVEIAELDELYTYIKKRQIECS